MITGLPTHASGICMCTSVGIRTYIWTDKMITSPPTYASGIYMCTSVGIYTYGQTK